MNSILHFTINFFLIDLIIGNAQDYVLLILIFSVIIDLDHIPQIMKDRKVRDFFSYRNRSRFHEIYGIALIGVALSLLSIFYSIVPIQIIALCIILHIIEDFFVGETRPFYPFDEDLIFMNMCPKRYRFVFEISLTIFLGVLLWLTY